MPREYVAELFQGDQYRTISSESEKGTSSIACIAIASQSKCYVREEIRRVFKDEEEMKKITSAILSLNTFVNWIQTSLLKHIVVMEHRILFNSRFIDLSPSRLVSLYR